MIGIFGGSFDPIHNGHIAMAVQAQEQLKLECVFFVPCNIHPFSKQFHSTNVDRLAMLKLALADYASFKLDEREINNCEKSYTYKTVLSFQEEFPEEKIALLIGMDAVAQFEQWHEWEALLDRVTLVVLPRSDVHAVIPLSITRAARKDTVIFLKNPLVDISSTVVREKCAAQENIETLVAPSVYHYIKQHHLYLKRLNFRDL